MVHQNQQPLLVSAVGEGADLDPMVLHHQYIDHHHQLFEPVIYAAKAKKPFWRAKSKKSRAKKKKKKAENDLSTTTVALYLLRYNVALQIAATAIVINLLLSVATFFFGLNSLYCAFGMDCVIGTITSCILVWRFASAKTEHIKQSAEEQAHLYLLNSSSSSSSAFSSSTPNGKLNAASLHEFLEASCRSGLSISNTADTSNISVDSINTKEDQNRELWSTFWLGQVMIVSGIGVVVRTVIEVVSHVMAAAEQEEVEHFFTPVQAQQVIPSTPMEPLYILALISLGLNLLLMVAKLVVYVFLRSNSMLIEGVNSFISALFASVAAVSIRYSSSVAYLDQIVSILFGIFLITYGGYNMLVTVGETVYQVVAGGGEKSASRKYFSTSVSSHHHRAQYQMLV